MFSLCVRCEPMIFGQGFTKNTKGRHEGHDDLKSEIMTNELDSFSIKPIGVIRSELKRIEDAPLSYKEGAPGAVIEVFPAYEEALHRMQVGDEIVIITWLHLGRRDVLKTHPRNDPANPLAGVFSTRSPDRPNPLGLHHAKVMEINSCTLRIDGMEAIDGTPVVDIKIDF